MRELSHEVVGAFNAKRQSVKALEKTGRSKFIAGWCSPPRQTSRGPVFPKREIGPLMV